MALLTVDAEEVLDKVLLLSTSSGLCAGVPGADLGNWSNKLGRNIKVSSIAANRDGKRDAGGALDACDLIVGAGGAAAEVAEAGPDAPFCAYKASNEEKHGPG